MSVLVYDEIMVREPRLLVPWLQPVAPIGIDRSVVPWENFWVISRGVGDVLSGKQIALTNAVFAVSNLGRYIDMSPSSSLAELPVELGKINLTSSALLIVFQAPASYSSYGGIVTRASAWNESNSPYFIETLAFGDQFVVGSMGTTWNTGISHNSFYSQMCVMIASFSSANAELFVNDQYAARGSAFSTPAYSTELTRLGTFYNTAKNNLLIHGFGIASKPISFALAKTLVKNPYMHLHPQH